MPSARETSTLIRTDDTTGQASGRGAPGAGRRISPPRREQHARALRGTHGTALLSVGELAERLYIRHHSAVGLVDRLAALGLVARRPGKPDRRRVLLSLTAGGRRVLAGLSAAHREELRQLGPRLRSALEAVTVPTLGGRAASQGAREVS